MLFTQYFSDDKIETNAMSGACGAYGGWVHRVLVGKPQGKRPLERPRRRWEDNIKMDLQEVGCGGWHRIGTRGGHFECGNEPSGSIKSGEFSDYLQNRLASQEGLCFVE